MSLTRPQLDAMHATIRHAEARALDARATAFHNAASHIRLVPGATAACLCGLLDALADESLNHAEALAPGSTRPAQEPPVDLRAEDTESMRLEELDAAPARREVSNGD